MVAACWTRRPGQASEHSGEFQHPVGSPADTGCSRSFVCELRRENASGGATRLLQSDAHVGNRTEPHASALPEGGFLTPAPHARLLRLTSFKPGDDVEVKWLYVGDNNLFDIYVRQGDGYNSRRVSDNLCGSESDGSCRGSSVGQAVVTLPQDLGAADDYVLLVVDRDDDDAHAISMPLSITLSVASAGGGSGMGLGLDNAGAEVAVLAAIFVAGKRRTAPTSLELIYFR